MTNTNFLTDPVLGQNFLHDGAVIQISENDFRVFIGPFEPCHELPDDRSSIFYMADFWSFLERKSAETNYLLPQKTFSLTRREFLEFLQKLGSANKKSTADLIDWSMPYATEFKQQYDWIQQKIQEGELAKALPISRQTGSGRIAEHLPEVLKHMLTKPTPNYVYGFWKAGMGLLGATPEVLCHWQKSQATLKTMALAGTWKKEQPSAIDFNDSKIQQEHNYVIEDIETQLSEFKQIEKSKTTVVELPHLFHLKTHFTYRCETLSDYLKVIHQLHPTAALGLFPRRWQTLKEFSQFALQEQRKQFGSPIGFVNADEGFMLVGIRNIIWTQNQIELFAGCGVTEDSVFEDEWNEIRAKQESVKKLLGLQF